MKNLKKLMVLGLALVSLQTNTMFISRKAVRSFVVAGIRQQSTNCSGVNKSQMAEVIAAAIPGLIVLGCVAKISGDSSSIREYTRQTKNCTQDLLIEQKKTNELLEKIARNIR